jgi:hypothetical protein
MESQQDSKPFAKSIEKAEQPQTEYAFTGLNKINCIDNEGWMNDFSCRSARASAARPFDGTICAVINRITLEENKETELFVFRFFMSRSKSKGRCRAVRATFGICKVRYEWLQCKKHPESHEGRAALLVALKSKQHAERIERLCW